MLLTALLGFTLPYPAAWVGSWEGPAVLNGHHKGRVRLEFGNDGTLVLSEIERDLHGRLYRTAYKGKVRQTGRALSFHFQGVLTDADDAEKAALAGESGTWSLRALRLSKGVLSVRADLDGSGEGHRFALRRRKG
ncbi:hypothetical protein EON82_01070 [bacterium]|nr:MAG: hypothetical protein EON82_01070 [bacterium]